MAIFQLFEGFSGRDQSFVFTNAQKKVEEIFGSLGQRRDKTALLHRGMDQTDRASSIHDFRQEMYSVLVLSSVGSQGLDIMKILLVVNYDAPEHEADCVHRPGRTGRAGNHDWGVTFAEPIATANSIEIMAAMKKSRALGPSELEALCKSGEVKRKWGSGGHGFRSDKSKSLTLQQGRKQKIDGDDHSDEQSECEAARLLQEKPETLTVEGVKQRKDGKFIAENGIDDFPNHLRQNLTKKQRLELTMDESGTSVIQRGVFVVRGTKAPIGER
jgi:ATP-dependent RNA helicase DDX46/PRP5